MEALGLVVVTHGRVAEELVNAARTILGHAKSLEAVSIDWDDDAANVRQRIEAAIRSADQGAGVLVLTDMFGGTPTNVALSFLEPGRVEVITGVNLPMLIKFSNLRDDLAFLATAHQIVEQGRAAIQLASEVLEGGAKKDRP